jgi:hypothetical protein
MRKPSSSRVHLKRRRGRTMMTRATMTHKISPYIKIYWEPRRRLRYEREEEGVI